VKDIMQKEWTPSNSSVMLDPPEVRKIVFMNTVLIAFIMWLAP